VLALGAASAVTATGALAQQQTDANGIAFSAEAGPTGKQSLFSLMSSKGAINGVTLRIVEGAKVTAVSRAAGTQVGTLRLDSVSSLLRLTIPSGTSSSRTLRHRGALKVVFSPKGRNVLTITGLPARTTSLQLTLRGGRGQLLSSASCRDEQNFQATVTRARKSVHARAGVTC
jgi:hypothetical protein